MKRAVQKEEGQDRSVTNKKRSKTCHEEFVILSLFVVFSTQIPRTCALYNVLQYVSSK